MNYIIIPQVPSLGIVLIQAAHVTQVLLSSLLGPQFRVLMVDNEDIVKLFDTVKSLR